MNFKTIKQTAREFGYSEWMLRQMLKEEKLPGFYRGNRFYINIDMLKAYIDKISMEAVKS